MSKNNKTKTHNTHNTTSDSYSDKNQNTTATEPNHTWPPLQHRGKPHQRLATAGSPHLQLHDVSAGGSANKAGADVVAVLGQGACEERHTRHRTTTATRTHA